MSDREDNQQAGPLPAAPGYWRRRKLEGPAVAALTAYDYPTARLLDEAGLDILLVGDSLGMVVLGYPDTTHVTMGDMIRHTGAVARAARRALVVADLPFGSYEDPAAAVGNARKLLDVGATAVKLEGATAVESQLQALADAGIPIVGHVGMLPQQVLSEGGYRRKGRDAEQAHALLADARLLQRHGALLVVLEAVVHEVAADITRQLEIPTIGIGSGPGTDGQIVVTHDLIGAFPWFTPPFATPVGDVSGVISRCAEAYVTAVRQHAPLRPPPAGTGAAR